MTTLTPTPEGFVDVMSSLPSGVCVVTAISEQAPAGMTTSSVTALSSDPMLVAVTLRPASRTLAAARFAINLIPPAMLTSRCGSPAGGRAKRSTSGSPTDFMPGRPCSTTPGRGWSARWTPRSRSATTCSSSAAAHANLGTTSIYLQGQEVAGLGTGPRVGIPLPPVTVELCRAPMRRVRKPVGPPKVVGKDSPGG
jgi:hypothetical protein